MSRPVFCVAMLFVFILNTYIIFWYGHRLFDYRRSFKTSLLICFGANMIWWLLLISFSSESLNMLSGFIVFWLIIFSAFKCDWKLAIFNTLFLMALMWFSEYVVLFLVSGILDLNIMHFKNDLVIFVEEAVASKFVFFIFLIIISLFSKKHTEKEGSRTSVFLTVLPITTFFIVFVLRTQSQFFEENTLTTALCISAIVLMFIANIVVFAVHEIAITNQKKIHDIEIVKQKQTINLEYLDILERKDEETRIFIHDIRNNLINISNLTDEESVKEYIQNIYDSSNEISINAKTKNRLLDVIINKYALICKDKHIKLTTDVFNENLSFISDYDLSAILDNLLSNAVESAEKEEDPYVSLALERDERFSKILIKNSCSVKPMEDGKNLVTRKQNKNIHGYGMRSVNKALKNYEGELEWTYENNEFKTVILIPVSN